MPRILDEISPDVITGPMGAREPQYPEWMQDRGPIVRGEEISGQQQLFHPNQTLPLWTKITAGLGLTGMLYAMDHWARPVLKTTIRQPKGDLFSRVIWSLGRVVKYLNPRMNYIGHEVSKGAAHNAAGPARTIGLLALRWEQLSWHLAYFVHEMELVTARIVHRVIPREVHRQTAPLKHRLHRVETQEVKTRRRLTGLQVWTHLQIEKQIKPQIRTIQHTTNKVLPRRIHRLETRQQRLQRTVNHDHALVHKLAPLLTPLGMAGLVLKAFGQLGLNFLRCENVKGVGQELCASPPGSGRRLGRLLRGLLSGLGGLLILPLFCQWFEAAIEIAAPVLSKIVAVIGTAGAALCGGKHSPAPPLPLRAAALPPSRNPLPL